jgi:hypothetical protein
MVMSNEQALALIAAAQEAASNGGKVPAELRCQYPSKRCDHVRTTKRGGGLHRLCSFHRQRANKNQWLVDQRRRQRREGDAPLDCSRNSKSSSPKSSPSSPLSSSDEESSIVNAIDVLDSGVVCAPLCDADLHILQALLFDDDDEDIDMADECTPDISTIWTV